MKPRFVYFDGYDFSFWGLDKLHPFNGKKFSQAWEAFISNYKKDINDVWIKPEVPIADNILLKLHTQEYLSALLQSANIARVIEIPFTKYLPNKILQNRLLTPIKLACTGTLMATEIALKEDAIAMNFGGGFHHAFADHGEGFCFFADAALGIVNAREKGLLDKNDKVLMIDVDAHRGNGFESIMGSEDSISIFDMYNFQVYPGLHHGEPDEYPYMIPLKSGMTDDVYLSILEKELDQFFNAHDDVKLIFYNAGNDVLKTDPLGGLNISFEGVVKRDQFVLQQLVKRNMPTVVMTSGGYTKQSHFLIAELARSVVSVTIK